MSSKDLGYELKQTRDIDPEAIRSIRQSVGWDPDTVEAWQEQLEVATAVQAAFIDERLVGIGFLLGTSRRHAHLVDVCVEAELQGNSIGNGIVSALSEIAQSSKHAILTCKPELEEFYSPHGWRQSKDSITLGISE